MSAAMCGTALAAQPPPPPPGEPPPPADSSKSVPDDGLIEFLGTDDVGDADWWVFLSKVPPRGANPPAQPPQEGRQ